MLRKLAMATALTVSMTTAAVAGEMKDIVDTAAADQRFSTLVEAVQAAGLVETLKSEGPFTVFAPTNAAFDQLPEGRLDTLMQSENQDELKDILTYHVVAGEKLMSSDLAGSQQNVETVQGSQLRIDAEGDTVQVNDAQVVEADIEASNGVIHAIDAVMTPAEQIGEMPEEGEGMQGETEAEEQM